MLAPPARLRSPRLALALILAATVGAYLPALTAPLYLDDYFYLLAARELSFADYARAAFTPWGNEPLLPFTRDFWRPLAFLSFELLQPLFGGRPLPYHLLLLGAHLATVVLTWALADWLDRRPGTRILAAAVVALHPASTEAVAWISSVNSAALPLALAAWLLFLRATEAPRPRCRLVAASAFVFALAAMTREGAWVIIPALVGWHILVTRRGALAARETWLPLVPFAVLAALYVLVRTRGFTEPLSNRAIFDYGDHVWANLPYYLGRAVVPFREPTAGWRLTLQEWSAPLVPAAIVALVALRRPRPALLLAAFVLSLFSVAPNLLGVGPRYLYFSIPLLALGGAIALADLAEGRPWLRRASSAAAPAVVVLGVVGAALVVDSRVAHWRESGPDLQQAWVEALQAVYPDLPEGATLYCAGNVPPLLTIFDGINLGPAVRWYYPAAAGAVYLPPGAEPPVLGPADRVFIAP
ncbi:hypothetical protein [Tepidiforma sp.]|uniref:hypothetical protein n=1 Tax=Tepidiforma sp. TaxID=2682230 RepID=UPI002ADDD831|nr:hypothetical protein [Tepidiforma sp.]